MIFSCLFKYTINQAKYKFRWRTNRQEYSRPIPAMGVTGDRNEQGRRLFMSSLRDLLQEILDRISALEAAVEGEEAGDADNELELD